MMITPFTPCAHCDRFFLRALGESRVIRDAKSFHERCLHADPATATRFAAPLERVRPFTVGFFRDFTMRLGRLPYIDELPTVALPEEDKIVAYLGAGLEIRPRISRHDAVDPYDDAHPVLGTDETLTDGVWLWSGYYAAVLRKYHVPVLPSFVEHMRASEWRVPATAR